MFFTITLYIALAICLIGTIWRVFNWFKFKIGSDALAISTSTRIAAAFTGIARTFFTRRIFSLLWALICDVIFQVRILKADFIRWFIHICIFGGFMMLLIMHALEDPISQQLFEDYASTLNPFMFLRNLFGAMVILGVAFALYRRIALKSYRKTTNFNDIFAIILLSIIIISGFLLEGTQIISSRIFDQMVEDYMGTDDMEEINPLKAYWDRDFDVVFSDSVIVADQMLLEEGMTLHEENCAFCHTKPSAAFISYPIAKIMKPAAKVLNETHAELILWYIHFLSCFIGLAYLPFCKFFHIFSTPVSLLIKATEDDEKTNPANKVTRRISGLDACTHCGVCTIHCSVSPVFRINPNINIFPSEKLISVKSMVSGQQLETNELDAISEGSYTCTECNRCTTLCPSGINLQDLWKSTKEELTQKGFPEPHIWVKRLTAAEWADKIKAHDFSGSPEKISSHQPVSLTDNPETFSPCVQCSTCANVCPVVAASDNPSQDLDLTPQQIMNLLRMGLKDLSLGSRMLWDCTTCYLCQEYCPQGIQVTDILYELRNQAIERLKAVKQNDLL